ncbi:MAG: DegT/DnrJ/EryC1/StrS family aminotransferase [Verrucomicrobia bacterium]|nr:DegT/DnrJ/EryC1/StrS family aminotransferase [Verrucomicrobiota bacterium]
MKNESSIRLLEAELCELTGRKHCIAVGRGATALYLAYKAIRERGSRIVMPPILCQSPASVALAAGLVPVFCDISLDDGVMEPDALRQMLGKYHDVAAVLAPHTYGNPADMDLIENICREHDVVLIEDAAQALGGMWKGRALGSLGDLSIVSFGHSKPLDFGGGGAVLTDNAELHSVMSELAKTLPPFSIAITRLQELYPKVYYALRDLIALDQRLDALLLPVPEIFRDMYIFSLSEDQAEVIRDRLPDVSHLVACHRRNAELYDKYLPRDGVRRQKPREGGVPWRYTFLVEGALQALVTETLREHDIDASNWYSSLHRGYASGREQAADELKNALYLEQHVVNLWVDPSVDEMRIKRTCELIGQVISAS